jgi:hypothetical protein
MTINLFQLSLFLVALVALGFGCRVLARRGATGAIGALIAGALSLGSFCLSGVSLWQSYRLEKGALSAEGEIVGIIVSKNTNTRSDPNHGDSSDTTSTSSPVVRFRPGGSERSVEFTALGNGNKSAAYAVGDRVNLLYLPEAPEQAKLNVFADLWLPGIVLAVAGLVLGIAAGAMWFVRKRFFSARTSAGSSMR